MPGGAPTMTNYLRWNGDQVAAATFEAAGCGVTIAACSMLTETVRGRIRAEFLAITVDDLDAALGGLPAYKRYCAALALEALARATANADPESRAEARLRGTWKVMTRVVQPGVGTDPAPDPSPSFWVLALFEVERGRPIEFDICSYIDDDWLEPPRS
jgi:hypothetical protein